MTAIMNGIKVLKISAKVTGVESEPISLIALKSNMGSFLHDVNSNILKSIPDQASLSDNQSITILISLVTTQSLKLKPREIKIPLKSLRSANQIITREVISNVFPELEEGSKLSAKKEVIRDLIKLMDSYEDTDLGLTKSEYLQEIINITKTKNQPKAA